MRLGLWGASALATGIALTDWLRPHPGIALAAVAVIAVLAAVSRGRRAAVLLMLTVGCLGALRYAWDQTAGRGDLAAWAGRRVTVTGTVSGEPEARKPRGVGYAVTAEQVDGHPAVGTLYLTQWSAAAPGFGERVTFSAVLKPPPGARRPGGYDRAAALSRQGIYLEAQTGTVERQGPGDLSWARRAAVATRLRLEAVFRAILPPRDAALMAGFLFGTRTDLPDDIRQAFKVSGVFHLLAVSGGNVATIILVLLFLLRRVGLGRRAAAAVAIPAVAFFVLLTGASPSVLRAGLMAMLVLTGDIIGRERDALNTLGTAVCLLLFWNPATLFDVGFQLSAGATLGILLFARRIEGWLTARFSPFFGAKVGGWLAAGLSVTFAAQVAVEPISLYNFGATSLIAPVANLLVLAFFEPVVKLGWAAVLVGLGWTALARLLGWAVRLGLWLLLFIVKATAAVPGAYLEIGDFPAWLVLVWYGALALVALPALNRPLVDALRRALRVQGARTWWTGTARSGRAVAAVCLVLVPLTAWTWGRALADPPDLLRITVIDVGQGDAVLVQAPGGHAMLIDAGPAEPPDPAKGWPGYDAGAEVVVPYLKRAGVRDLDYLVLTHPHQDHAGGMPAVLRALPVRAFLDTQLAHDVFGYAETTALVAQKGIPVQRPVAGQRLHLGPLVTLEVLNPPPEQLHGTRSDENSNSIVFLLHYRQITILLTGDMEAVVEERLLAEGVSVKADLLKVAHHGSAYSTTDAFLRAVEPRWALVSAGSGNSFGHPDRGTLDRLHAVGAAVYRTDRHGTLTVRTDGLTLSVTPARLRPPEDGSRPIGLFGRRWVFAW